MGTALGRASSLGDRRAKDLVKCWEGKSPALPVKMAGAAHPWGKGNNFVISPSPPLKLIADFENIERWGKDIAPRKRKKGP